jgi:hypothetical protein
MELQFLYTHLGLYFFLFLSTYHDLLKNNLKSIDKILTFNQNEIKKLDEIIERLRPPLDKNNKIELNFFKFNLHNILKDTEKIHIKETMIDSIKTMKFKNSDDKFYKNILILENLLIIKQTKLNIIQNIEYLNSKFLKNQLNHLRINQIKDIFKDIKIEEYETDLKNIITKKNKLEKKYNALGKTIILYDKLGYYIDCVNSKLSPNLNNIPSFMYSDKPKYMLNYCYFWYEIVNIDGNQNYTILKNKNNNYLINQIIFEYSYPTCILQQNLSKEEKNSIISDEYNFINTKISNESIKLFQIPRILYDLFNILYNIENVISDMWSIDFKNDNINDYFKKIEKLHLEKKDIIIDINNKFIEFVNKHEINLLNKSNEIYFKIFKILYEELVEKMDYQISFDLKKKLLDIENYDNIVNKRLKTILFQILLIELGYIYDIQKDIYLLNNDPKKMILYRGYSGNIFSTIYDDQPYSISFNTSILNGIFNDKTANTYYYMKPGCTKGYYLINKHFLDDSEEAKVFFIPPVHPMLLLYGAGEFWHARTKLFKISDEQRKIGAHGIAHTTPENLIPTFIISDLDRDTLEEKFHKLINYKSEIIDKYYQKYLKYKAKYLQLKLHNN